MVETRSVAHPLPRLHRVRRQKWTVICRDWHLTRNRQGVLLIWCDRLPLYVAHPARRSQ